jgi:plasmid maintenance system antidote protein VapI
MRATMGDTALRLTHGFGTSPQFWMNLQALYYVRLAARSITHRATATGGRWP